MMQLKSLLGREQKDGDNRHERRWAVTVMGDSIIFIGGIAVGSLITMFICMVAIISDDIRMWKEKEREFRQENEDN